MNIENACSNCLHSLTQIEITEFNGVCPYCGIKSHSNQIEVIVRKYHLAPTGARMWEIWKPRYRKEYV